MNEWKLHRGSCLEFLHEYVNQIDMVITSPPYDKLRSYGGHDFDFDAVADAITPVLVEGGVMVWVVADATINGSETGTSFKHALGFIERGLNLHDTMIYQKHSTPPFKNAGRYNSVFEYMFVFSRGKPKTHQPDIRQAHRGRRKRRHTHNPAG